ncbi:N-acylethanolamine-hydrolyzing acid amidase-like [Menidia menidia]
MVWTVVLVLALAASCRAQRPPPTVNISLDEDPATRWKPLLQVFDVDYLNKAAAEVIDSTVPKWVHHAVKPIVSALEKYIPQPYAEEIRGMASFMGGNLSDIVILNFAYEVTAFCTSIVAQDDNGNVYHGRNLDYPHDVLKNLTVDIVFFKNGKEAYRGTSFAGYVGIWTGQSPGKFTVSGDQRGTEHWWNWWKNVVSAALLHRSPVSWLVRETLEEAEDFQDAVMRLSKTPLITGVYYIVGGVRAGEGVIITRDRTGPVDIWPLDPLNGGWFRVETNYDHWLPPRRGDHRREAAIKALNATGQEHINMDTLYQVLSLPPVCNGITIYTTLMSAASPEKYTTVVRSQECVVSK